MLIDTQYVPVEWMLYE